MEDMVLSAALRKYPLYYLVWTIVGLFYFNHDLTQGLL